MWINSMQREEPYLGLTCARHPQRWGFPCGWCTGGAWLSSARVVRCWVKSRNERNPYPMLPAGNAGDSWGTAGAKPEEGGDEVKSSCPLRPGLHTRYNGRYKGLRTREGEPIPKSRSQFGLQSANTVPRRVPTARHPTKVGNTRSQWPNPFGRELSKVALAIGVKS